MSYSSPVSTPESEHYWKAANDGRLLLKQCQDCGRAHHYPRPRCPFCMSSAVKWVEAIGLGTIYSFTIIRRGPGSGSIPAFITLDEGPTLMAGLVDCPPDAVEIGDRVRVSFVPSQDGQMIPLFAPVKDVENA